MHSEIHYRNARLAEHYIMNLGMHYEVMCFVLTDSNDNHASITLVTKLNSCDHLLCLRMCLLLRKRRVRRMLSLQVLHLHLSMVILMLLLFAAHDLLLLNSLLPPIATNSISNCTGKQLFLTF